MKNQLTLGQFIFLLSRVTPDAGVLYDFGSFVPVGIDSYRGYYDQLALGFAEYKEVKASALLTACKDAIGATFTGWKGGDFNMGEQTPLWVANRGDAHGTAIVGIVDEDYRAIIETAYVP